MYKIDFFANWGYGTVVPRPMKIKNGIVLNARPTKKFTNPASNLWTLEIRGWKPIFSKWGWFYAC